MPSVSFYQTRRAQSHTQTASP